MSFVKTSIFHALFAELILAESGIPLLKLHKPNISEPGVSESICADDNYLFALEMFVTQETLFHFCLLALVFTAPEIFSLCAAEYEHCCEG